MTKEKAHSLVKSSATIGFYTMISRVLGFARDVTIASFLGASWLSDAFFVAFKIPNFLRRLFAEGAFNAAFVPMFASMLAGDGEEKAKQFADEALSLLVSVLLLVSVICILLMPWLMLVLAPGFDEDLKKYDLTVLLTQITMPYIVFISVVSLLGGILNSFNRFAAVAATPILMNICLILVPIPVKYFVPTYAHALAISVFVAGLAQMLWLIFWCKKLGVMPRMQYPKLTERIRKLFRLMAPAAMGAGVAQINLFIDLIIASHIAGGVSYLYYADRLNELPLAIIGIAVGTALLPMLSKQLREGKIEAAKHSQNRAMEFALILALPACMGLIMLAEPLIRVLYERGEFNAIDTAKTFPALIAFAAGLPAFILIKVLTPAFYANHDTKTPFKIATLCIAVNLVLNLLLIQPLAHVGMALATTLAGWLNVSLLVWQLEKRDLFKADEKLKQRLPRIVASGVAMSTALLVIAPFFASFWQMSFVPKLMGLLLLCTAGGAVYSLALLGSKAVSLGELKGYVRRKA
jgi:putative peptidoglycan lipid II flippase